MMRFRTAALGAVLTIGLAAVAGAQTPARADSAHRGMRGDRAGKMGHGMRGMRGARGMKGGRGMGGKLMADLRLSDAQKNQIKLIHEKYQPQMKALREQGRTQFEALRGARQKGDTSTAARQRFRQQNEQFRQRVTDLRAREQGEVRGVLTSDQRAKWDAAAADRKKKMDEHRGRMKQKRGSRAKA